MARIDYQDGRPEPVVMNLGHEFFFHPTRAEEERHVYDSA